MKKKKKKASTILERPSIICNNEKLEAIQTPCEYVPFPASNSYRRSTRHKERCQVTVLC